VKPDIMSDEKRNKNIDKYAEDLATIKSLLMDVDNRPFLEYWAFYTWGGLILVGTLIHYWLRKSMALPEPKLFLYIWLPLFFLAAFLETIAWLKKMSKESMPLMNRVTMKMFIAMGGVMGAMVLFLVIAIEGTGYMYLPHVVVATYGIFLLYFAQISHFFYFGSGYFLVLAAIILYVLPVPKDAGYLFGGVILALTFIVTGELTRRAEKEDQ